MLDIFSNKIEPVNFEQESEIIKSQITELLSDIDSKLRYRRKQPTRSDIEKLEERYKKIKEKLKKIEENFKKEISKLKLDRSNLNGKNFQQNTDVQAFSNNSSSTTKISKMNNIINKFTYNKTQFLVKLINEDKTFSEIKKIYTNANVNKINNKKLKTAKQTKNFPKNSKQLFDSIIKLHQLLNSLEAPNSSDALRKTVLNTTVKYVTDKLKLINEKKKFLFPPNNGSDNANANASASGPGNGNNTNASGPGNGAGNNTSVRAPGKVKTTRVNGGVGSQIEQFESYKKFAALSGETGAGVRRSGRARKQPQPAPGMIYGNRALKAISSQTGRNRGGAATGAAAPRARAAAINNNNKTSLIQRFEAAEESLRGVTNEVKP